MNVLERIKILAVIFSLISIVHLNVCGDTINTNNVQLRSLLSSSQTNNDDDIAIITLISNDNQTFNVSKQLISQSKLIGQMLQDKDNQDNVQIPIPNIDGITINTILTYLNITNKHANISQSKNGCNVKCILFISTCTLFINTYIYFSKL